MTLSVEYRLLSVDALLIHEQIVPERVGELVRDIRAQGAVVEPILVARGSHVILNGHHRFAALRQMGARRIPAWVVDYEDDAIVLERWYDGPPLSKAEVVERARDRRPFTPKTTKHLLKEALPSHPTRLDELLDAEGRSDAPPRRAQGGTSSGRRGASGSSD